MRRFRHFVHRQLLLPAFESGIKRRRTFTYWKELERSQWTSAGEIHQLQLERLRALVAHVSERCPYYALAWEGIDLSLKTLEDFARWPVISRETIRENRVGMRAAGFEGRLIQKSTGGSSGAPLEFELDHDSNDRRMAAWHRGYGWAGAGLGTKQLYLWGVPLGQRSRWKQCKDGAYNWMYRREVLNSFEFSEQRVAQFLERVNRSKPDAIVAYTGPLYAFARALEERGMKPVSPKTIVVGAEKLHGFQRELIERVFETKVYETYGSREFMLIGAECDRREGLHLTSEHLLMEILDDQGKPVPEGQEGNVVITDLFNLGMPFIRYRTDDRAVAGFGVCSCGRGLPLLKKVVGRRLDVVITPDGRKIAGEFFPHLIKDFAAVRRFQVVQEALDRVELRVVAPQWNEESKAQLEKTVRTTLGPTIFFRLAVVDEIPLTPAGKLQVVVNRVGEN